MSKKKQVATESTETGNTGHGSRVTGDDRTKYAFSGQRCPACGSTDTEARSTQGHVQYRHCRRIGCVHHHKNYPVIGKEI